MIKEDFLHYIWKYALYDSEYMQYKKERIRIVNPGLHNKGSGPDFFNAKIQIGKTLWAGNVEIHTCASDWYRHNHQLDPAYDNIILHVVYDPDRAVYRRNGEEIPFVRLSFHPGLIEKYKELIRGGEEPPCYSFFCKMDRIHYTDWIGKLGISRLERRVGEVEALLAQSKYDWESALYQLLGKAFGANQNSLPFQMLTVAVPLKFIYKNQLNYNVLNAAFFGQAGFLDETLSDDRYYISLQKEYQMIRCFLPEPLPGKHLWKIMRLRPPSFPRVRIPQFISLIRNFFPAMNNLLQTSEVSQILQAIERSMDNYWVNHFLYGQPGRRPEYLPGRKTCFLWILNAMVPVLFAWGKLRNQPDISDKAMRFLEQIPAEDNEILKKWNKFGIRAGNAFESQSLIELKTRYCDMKRCTECLIGHNLLQHAGANKKKQYR